jgi:hypothetical protein
MVALGYMKYLDDRNKFCKIADELVGVDNVVLKPSLIKKIMEKFNVAQEKIRELEFDKFANSYISTPYGFKHPAAGERMRMHNELNTWHHLINYREAKKMLIEYKESMK